MADRSPENLPHIHILWVIASPWRGRGETSALLLTNRLCWKQWDISPVITFHEPIMFLLAGFLLWALKPAAMLWAALQRGPHGKEPREVLANNSWGFEVLVQQPMGSGSCQQPCEWGRKSSSYVWTPQCASVLRFLFYFLWRARKRTQYKCWRAYSFCYCFHRTLTNSGCFDLEIWLH